MNLRDMIVSMGKLVSRIFPSSRRKMLMVFCIMKDLVLGIFFLSIVVYNWALLMYEDTIKFCPLVLYLVTLLLSLIRIHSLSEHHNGFSI